MNQCVLSISILDMLTCVPMYVCVCVCVCVCVVCVRILVFVHVTHVYDIIDWY